MSSLAAARADNFYYPPGFDPEKHGSLNKFQGQHPLRDRARKLDKGILIIRFEVPFNIWCCQCGEHIAKGVRFNAEKKQVGNYHSTKIWAFTMRHHCGCMITIQTDPKITDYVVTEGAQRKVEKYDAEDAQTIELPDAAEQAAIAADPLASLERKTIQAQAAVEGKQQLVRLAVNSNAKHKDEFALNKQLRAKLRASKKADAQLDKKREALGLPEHVKLLEESAADKQTAQLVHFEAQEQRFIQNWQNKRRKLLTESIFPATGGSGTATGKPKGSSSRFSGGFSSSSSKTGLRQQLHHKLISGKRKLG